MHLFDKEDFAAPTAPRQPVNDLGVMVGLGHNIKENEVHMKRHFERVVNFGEGRIIQSDVSAFDFSWHGRGHTFHRMGAALAN
eukprot:5289319-Amphidinium_carterae.1